MGRSKRGGVVNPFINASWGINPYEAFKMVVFGLTLFPLRAIVIFFCVLLGGFFALLATVGADPEKPLKGFRRAMLWPLRIMCRVILFALGFYWIRVYGKKKSSKEAPILVCNHTSIIEPIFFMWHAFPMTVAKAQLANIPLIGRIVKATQPILVDRNDPKSRHNVAESLKTRARSRGEWPQMMIYPEGTCTNGRALITFKAGAFLAGEPVQPATVQYFYTHHDVSTVPGGPSDGMILFRTMCQVVNLMTVRYLPVYTPSEAEESDPNLFAENVRDVMADELNIPVTEHTFGDVLLANEAKRLRLGPDKALIEFGKLDKVFGGLKVDDAKSFFRKFAKADKSGDGLLSTEEFAEALGVEPDNETLVRLFEMYDIDGDGQIDFREFLSGALLFSKNTSFDEAVEVSFSLFDISGTGSIREKELRLFLRRAFKGMTRAKIHEIFVTIDKDKDGVISREEFEEFAAENPEYVQLALEAYREDKSAYHAVTIGDLSSSSYGDGSTDPTATSDASSSHSDADSGGDSASDSSNESSGDSSDSSYGRGDSSSDESSSV